MAATGTTSTASGGGPRLMTTVVPADAELAAVRVELATLREKLAQGEEQHELTLVRQREELTQQLTEQREELAREFQARLDGAVTAIKAAVRTPPAADTAAVATPHPVGAANSVGAAAAAGEAAPAGFGVYSKYHGGFEGTFATMQQFQGGLLGLLGAPPKPDLIAAMQREHCEVADGFGASDVAFITTNYGGNRTTPREEWLHVFDPHSAPALPAGTGPGGRALGMRKKVPWEFFKTNILTELRKSWLAIGWDAKAEKLLDGGQAALDRELQIEDGELIALRLYTGPCFMIYNTVLRALGNPDAPGVVPAYDGNFSGQDVRGRYVTTLHALNHGCIKFARLSVAKEVHRGFAGMKLPESFEFPDENNVRGGGEFGFMSTTADRDVALGYTAGHAGEARTLLTAKMNLASRAAFIAYLSQYPAEKELLWPPMCGIEVTAEPVTIDGVIQYAMTFHTNTTICAADGGEAEEPSSAVASLPAFLQWLPDGYSAEEYLALSDAELQQVLVDEQGMKLMDGKALVENVRTWAARRLTVHLDVIATDVECEAAEARRELLQLEDTATDAECAEMELRRGNVGLPHSAPLAELEVAEERRRTLHLDVIATDVECEAAEARRELLQLEDTATDAECAEMELRLDNVGLPPSAPLAELEVAEERRQRRRTLHFEDTAIVSDAECEAAEAKAARTAVGLGPGATDYELAAAQHAAAAQAAAAKEQELLAWLKMKPPCDVHAVARALVTQVNVDGDLPLHMALYADATEELVELMLCFDAARQLAHPGRNKALPIHIAAMRSSQPTVVALLPQQSPQPAVVALLLARAPGSVNAPNKNGRTPLKYAWHNTSIVKNEIVAMLKAAGGR
jgi:hypothetical protein